MTDGKPTNFNKVARIYWLLEKLVFGDILQRAQQESIATIDASIIKSILIIGGGNGTILHHIHTHLPNPHITYIEASEVMMSLSKKNAQKLNRTNVSFILSNSNINIPTTELYDLIITNFYLDVFPEYQAIETMNHIKHHVSKNGFWIVTDFVEPKPRQYLTKALLWMMFRFFKTTASLKNNALFNYFGYIEQCGFHPISTKKYYNGFIQSCIFKQI